MTRFVSKPLMSRLVKASHQENMADISVTFDVSKLLTSMLVKEEHELNMPAMLVTLAVLK